MRKILALSLLAMTGCLSCPEKPLIVNTLDQGSKTIMEQHKQWAEHLGADPGMRAELPVLTPQQQENIRQLHAEWQDTLNTFRSE